MPLNTWTSKANLSLTSRRMHATGALGGKVHVAGGRSGGGAIDTHEAYDPTTNTWTSKASMPGARQVAGGAVVGGKLYVCGGLDAAAGIATSLYEYNSGTNTWATKAVMIAGRYRLGASSSKDGRLFAIGGNDGSVSGRNEVWDPATNAWTSKAAMPTARIFPAPIRITTKETIHAIGGVSSGGSTLDTHEAYDPTTNTWTTKASMTNARTEGMTGTSEGSYLHYFGGLTAGSWQDTNYRWAFATNTWDARAVLPAGRSASATANVAGFVYVPGGELSGGSVTNTHVAYEAAASEPDESTPVPTTITLLPASAAKLRGASHTVTANVKDQTGANMQGVRVRFSVAGPNAGATHHGLTDANGNIDFTYTGAVGGTDTITAYADTDDDGTHDGGEPSTPATVVFSVLGTGMVGRRTARLVP